MYYISFDIVTFPESVRISPVCTIQHVISKYRKGRKRPKHAILTTSVAVRLVEIERKREKEKGSKVGKERH